MKQQNLIIAAIALVATTSIFTACGGDSFTDPRDGQKYKTVKIGEHVWMAENLKYKEGAESIGDAGVFYAWDEALVACPNGWHLPSKEELEGVATDSSFNGIWSSTEKEDFSLYAYLKDEDKLTVYSKSVGQGVRCIQGNGINQQRLLEINGHKAVRIGKQIWMANNIDVVTPNSVCYLEDDEECSKGRFYSISEAKNICPEGWRLPNRTDASALINKLSKYCKDSDCPDVRKFWGPKMGHYDNKAQFYNGTGVMIIGYWLLSDGYYVKNHVDLSVNKLDSWMMKLNVRCIADSANKE